MEIGEDVSDGESPLPAPKVEQHLVASSSIKVSHASSCILEVEDLMSAVKDCLYTFRARPTNSHLASLF